MPAARRPPRSSPTPARRRPRASRLAPLALLAVVAFAAGAVAGQRHEPPALAIARQWAQAWSRGDYAAMHALLTKPAQRRASVARFVRTYRTAADTLTLRRVTAGRPREEADGVYALPVLLDTRIFGRLSGSLRLPIVEQDGVAGVDWRAQLVYPGLRLGEKLARETTLPARGAILARDGTPLAKGPNRLSDLGPLVAEVAGRVGPIPPERAGELARRGVPPEAQVGLNGLEREFDVRLSGRPGGVLRAGGRSIARAEPVAGEDVRSSIDPEVQRAAVEALAGRFGGIAVLRPATGEVLALAGIAYSAPQPPGSTFKIVTLAGALEAKVVRDRDSFPVQTSTTLEGVELENANGEACGGTLKQVFAESCNSVFAPLGAKLGARRLVATAERFGFNEQPTLVRRGPLHPPGGGRDRRRPRRRLERDRPGQGARHPAADRLDRGDHRPARPARAPDPLARRPRRRDAGGADPRGARDRPLHARRGDLGHGLWRRDPGPEGGRQDRHGRAARHRLQGRPQSARARRHAHAGAGGGQDRHRRLVHRLRALRQAARRARGAARRPGRGRRDRGARGAGWCCWRR